tara:strand:+ start:144 stop:1220 length:1077 start_codon:yes stop_codon:yes gene_type:complete
LKKIDWYILKQFLYTFFYVLIILCFVITVIDYAEKNDKFIKHNLSFEEIRNYYFSFIPFIASLITPITAFVATVYVTANLSIRSEIIALLSSGFSLKRIMLPYLYGGIIIAIMSFLLNGWILPKANKSRVNFEVSYIKNPYYFSKNNVHFKISDETYLYLERYDNNLEVGNNVSIEKFTNNSLKERLIGRQLVWDSEDKIWEIKSWQLRILNGDGNEEITSGLQLDTALLINPSDFDNNYKLNETLTLTELNKYIDLLKLRGSDSVVLYEIEKYIRYTQPFTILILILIGVIVSSRKSRQGTGILITLGFLFAFSFIIFFVMSRAFAENGSLNPLFAIWIPNLVFILIGIIMYRIIPR